MVALLTDFGAADGYVGVMKAVILGIASGMPLVDLSHEIAPQDVRGGAWVLHTLWRYLPQGTVCLAVVDPGVGTERRPVAFQSEGRIYIGPDNGLFSYLLDAATVESAVVLENPLYQLPAPSATFHGRDIFAPAAGHLAAGVPLDELGPTLEPETLRRFHLPKPTEHAHGLVGEVVHVDRFGNLITSFGPAFVGAVLDDPRVTLRVGPAEIGARARTFATAPADVPFALVDSSGHLTIAVREGSAAARLGAGTGSEVLAVGATFPVDHR
jgi:hypothetical protein